MAVAVSALAEPAQGPQGINLYARFAVAGALGCSITHGAFTPVDVYAAAALSSLIREWTD